MKIIALNSSPRKALSRTGQIIGEILVGSEFYCVGRIACTLDDGPVAGGSLIMQQADKLGRDMVRAIVEKHQFPDQIQTIEGMRQYFRSIMIKHKGRWDWEYRYWQDKGWLE